MRKRRRVDISTAVRNGPIAALRSAESLPPRAAAETGRRKVKISSLLQIGSDQQLLHRRQGKRQQPSYGQYKIASSRRGR